MNNVECRNFLNDYQSLIHIENDNLLTFSQKISKTGSHYGSNQVGGKIHIMSSRFVDSSFTYGLLFNTPRKPLAMQQNNVVVYTYCEHQGAESNSL